MSHQASLPAAILCYNIGSMKTPSLPAVQLPHVLDFISHSLAQTERIGQRLGEYMQAGDVVLLLGNVGVGKTHLVKGIARGLGSTDLVTSPSFVLINEYQADPQHAGLRIYHVDLYRIDDPAELTSIGLEEIWNDQGVCLIEWAERAQDWLPNDHLAIHMQHLSETKRILRFVPHGERYQQLVEAFKGVTFG
jgi:tRNA threonylcarbamoyladenosine biosynthesis protein TsaE